MLSLFYILKQNWSRPLKQTTFSDSNSGSEMLDNTHVYCVFAKVMNSVKNKMFVYTHVHIHIYIPHSQYFNICAHQRAVSSEFSSGAQ